MTKISKATLAIAIAGLFMNMFSGFAYGKQISTETSIIECRLGGEGDCVAQCKGEPLRKVYLCAKELPLTNKK